MKRRIFTRILLSALAVFLVVVLLNITGLFSGSSATYPAKLGTIEVSLEKTGFVVRREISVGAGRGGAVQFLVDDNTRVAKGTPVARITPSGDAATAPASPYANRLQELTIDFEALRSRIHSLEDELTYLVRENKFTEIDALEKRLDALYVIEGSYDSPVLTFQSASISGGTEEGQYIVRAPEAGVVGLRTSAADPLFDFDNRMLLQYGKLMNIEQGEIKSQVAAHEGLFRLIDNRSTFVVVLLSPEELDIFRSLRRQRINATINGEALRPVVEEVFESPEQQGVVLRFLETFEGDQDLRKLQINVIPKRFTGLVIKTSSIVEVGNVQGVYVMRGENDFVFMPIQIKGISGEQAVIESDYFLVGEEQEMTDTVSLYDEIREVGR